MLALIRALVHYSLVQGLRERTCQFTIWLHWTAKPGMKETT